MFNGFYKNKKILVTGHTGFKGGWLSLWLCVMGAEVLGFSLEPATSPSLYETLNLKSSMESVLGDIKDKEHLQKVFEKFKPEIVFHLAAQPLVRLSYFDPVTTYETNVLGTLNILEAARNCPSVQAFVNVTSDKCYENRETDYGYCETDPLGGYDMYSSSKGCAEILTASYRRSFLKNGEPFALASARAGNVIGGGDWAADRLVPDCVRFITQNKPITIRNPEAIRPWQHVLEPLSGYLLLGQKLSENGIKYSESFNFGPCDNSVLTVEEITSKIVTIWGQGEVIVQKDNTLHEAKLLKLNIKKAEEILNWKPLYNADKALESTVEWYKKFYGGEKMIEFTEKQILNYSEGHKKIWKNYLEI